MNARKRKPKPQKQENTFALAGVVISIRQTCQLNDHINSWIDMHAALPDGDYRNLYGLPIPLQAVPLIKAGTVVKLQVTIVNADT